GCGRYSWAMRRFVVGLFVLSALGCGSLDSRAGKGDMSEGVWEVVPKVDGNGGGIATWISSGGAVVRVELPDGEPGLGRPVVLNWVRNCADAVSAFYGKFPV